MSQISNRLTIFSWSLYDFANTIFSMNVISLYFALWVTVDHDGQDILYSTALSLSMLAVALSVPVFGVLSDTTGKRRVPLTALTLLCVFCTGLIGTTDHLWTGLILFMVANYGYQSALVFYNGMLPSISRPLRKSIKQKNEMPRQAQHDNKRLFCHSEEQRDEESRGYAKVSSISRGNHVGLVSGYGVALGYLGSIIGMLMVQPFVESGGRSSAFLPTAGLLLFFSLPCFLLVKDPEIGRAAPPVHFKEAFNTLKQTFLRVRQYRSLFRFILIHFLVLDAVNTIIAFMSVYASKVIGFSGGQIAKFLISSTVFAMIGSWVIGILVKHKGIIWSYWLVLALWIAALSLAAISQSEALFWLVGPIAGVGMGGVWVVSRAFIIELSPPEKVGEFFGLYGMAGKAASIIGPLLWGGVVWTLDTTGTLKYRVAVTVLLGIVVAAAFLFRGLTRQLQPQ